MPITALDPSTALVVIDLQRGIVGMPLAHPVGDVVANAAKLAEAFRRKELPVVLVTVAGGASGRADVKPPAFARPPGWADVVPELNAQPSDILVTKYTWGAFHGTPLDLQLRRRGVTQIVLCGISTSAGVESTARAAHEHGYNVTLAIDAMTDRNPDTHRNSVENIFPRLGETGATADVLARLGA